MKKQPSNKFTNINDWLFHWIEQAQNCLSINLIPLHLRNNRYIRLMRLDKPASIFLWMLPVLWAVALASHSVMEGISYSIIFIVGGMLLRTVGCIINDIWDKDFDKIVLRTQMRPVANGEVSTTCAFFISVILLLTASPLLLMLSQLALKIAFFSLIPIIVYPLFKRFTHYPQIFLGFTYNLGILIAWFTISQKPSYNPFLIYLTAVIWTTSYDTIYGFQDKKDDLKLGLKSLAIRLGDKAPGMIWASYQLVVATLCIVGVNTHMNCLFYVVMAFSLYHLYWQTETVNIDDPQNCAKRFNSNVYFGFIVLIAILVGKF